MLLFYILTSRFSFLRSLSISYYALIVFIIFRLLIMLRKGLYRVLKEPFLNHDRVCFVL